ncbi:UNVERIFIED_CONTAM: hypothetical protein HDU68_002896 [Siphonaria sp. JEL0065]|nr:hypothetical protein HDU68_002896 [Siphonaria sp. JEL0065]
MSTPLSRNTAVMNSGPSSSSSSTITAASQSIQPPTSQAQKKQSASSALNNGERGKQSHSTRNDSCSGLERSLDNAMALFGQENVPATPPIDRFSAIPEAFQLSLRASEHLGSLLTCLGGHFKNEEFEWLNPSLLIKYCQVFNRSNFHAAIFFRLPNDETAVHYLQDLHSTDFRDL